MSVAIDAFGVPDLAQLHRRRSEKWDGYTDDVLVSTIAEMDFPVAAPIAAALKEAIERDDLGYAPRNPTRLRRAFADFAQRRLNWTVDPEAVWSVPDVTIGVTELCRVLLGPGEAVAFGTPAYPPFLWELPGAAGRIRAIPLRPDGAFDLDALTASFTDGTRAVLLSNPHNPTGRVAPPSELGALADLCVENDIWVISDEIHAPLVLPGALHTPWLEVSDAARECGVALTSASKAFNIAGLKTALIVAASARVRDAVTRISGLSDHAGLLGVIAAEVAFTECDVWLDALLAKLSANRALLGDLLAAQLPAVRWKPPDASYLAWLDCRGLGLGDDPAEVFLERGRVALSSGPSYGQPGAGYVRLNFGTSPELVREAVRRMAASL